MVHPEVLLCHPAALSTPDPSACAHPSSRGMPGELPGEQGPAPRGRRGRAVARHTSAGWERFGCQRCSVPSAAVGDTAASSPTQAEGLWGAGVCWVPRGGRCLAGVLESSATLSPCPAWWEAETKPRVCPPATSDLMISRRPRITSHRKPTARNVPRFAGGRAPTVSVLLWAPTSPLSSARKRSARRQWQQEHPETGRQHVRNGTLPKTPSRSGCSSRSR